MDQLAKVDADPAARKRVLAMETNFRDSINSHVNGLPASDARLSKFNTNPFVLMIHSLRNSYCYVSQIEGDLLPAKVFSSMETSAGRMVEKVVLRLYGWDVVPSKMHSPNSALDGSVKKGPTLCLVTLKSGPRCLNDEMSENFADAVLGNFEQWAHESRVKDIDFTYGVLYGTKKQSNKKDWHILRNIVGKLKGGTVSVAPSGRWDCKFEKGGITVRVTVRIGMELWNYLAGSQEAFIEVATALIRACISPSNAPSPPHKFAIGDLPAILSLEPVPRGYNPSLLQRSQLEWLFFFARHFCDDLRDGA